MHAARLALRLRHRSLPDRRRPIASDPPPRRDCEPPGVSPLFSATGSWLSALWSAAAASSLSWRRGRGVRVADRDLDELRRRRTQRIGDGVAQGEVGVRGVERRGDRERQPVDHDGERCRIVVDRQHQRIAVRIDGIDDHGHRGAGGHHDVNRRRGGRRVDDHGHRGLGRDEAELVDDAVRERRRAGALAGMDAEAVVREPLDRAHFAVGEGQRVGH